MAKAETKDHITVYMADRMTIYTAISLYVTVQKNLRQSI